MGFYIKDVILSEDKSFNLRKLIQNIIFVPPSMKITSLFVKMRSSRSYLAVVLDEYGETDGLISVTDLVEELLSNIDSGSEPFKYEIVKLSQSKFYQSQQEL